MMEDVKLTVIGDSQVGKTCIIQRYVENSFGHNALSTVSSQFTRKIAQIDNTYVRFQIWDTAGQEKFRSIAAQYFRSALAIILVFDVTSKSSFDSLTYWIKQIRQKSESNAVVVLVGNKSDACLRVIPYKSAFNFAEQCGVNYFETSALTGEGIEDVFQFLAQKCSQINVPEESEAVFVQKDQGCC
ncbi:Rab11 [Hexamita inflata]|uniref:Rab11 n=1 Tax=Hexamita inflata TaxID=28002 RepID=A0ABP1I0I1_9EUKA